jgi:two-component system, OmpR family, alkaline phosphatase synthesis response regulator PhoP
MKKKILVVDDDVQLCQLASDILEEHGFHPLTAHHTDQAFQKLQEQKPDLILLDVWLPSIGGLEFCRQVRLKEDARHVPILMLTVQDKETDKVMGLDMGADDYMTKPFGQRELLARIRALLRRAGQDDAAPGKTFLSGDLEVDMEKHRVKLKNKTVPVTPKEFDLLAALVQNRRKAMNSQSLLAAVWGYDAPATMGTVHVHIRHLRKKLGAHGDKIKTILGFGYRFDG